jgi:hypothetical protein
MALRLERLGPGQQLHDMEWLDFGHSRGDRRQEACRRD